jgi:DNA processing protein
MTIPPDERAAMVALSLVPAVGPARLAALLDACQTALGALSAPFAFLATIPGISRACATDIAKARLDEGVRVIARTQELGGRVLLIADPDYPAMLRTIPDPPPVLYARGDLALAGKLAVAIVGSRDHSGYGAEVARLVAGGAAGAGLVVVSGMARGLDAIAHAAALDAGGTTVGILGNGLGVIYPAANRRLYERVGAQGCLLTEFPPGERPTAGSFPRRNRLISGLARVTVVIEAASGSGTMITVDTALAQGREVMAVPGAITSPVSAGTNRLLRDGATPLLELADLLRHYPEVAPVAAASSGPAAGSMPPIPPHIGPLERRILELLRTGTLHVDALAEHLELPVGGVLGLLSALELQGLATSPSNSGWWQAG